MLKCICLLIFIVVNVLVVCDYLIFLLVIFCLTVQLCVLCYCKAAISFEVNKVSVCLSYDNGSNVWMWLL